MDICRLNSGAAIRRVMIFALSMCLLVSMNSGAQTQSEAAALADDLFAAGEAIGTITKNILQMYKGLAELESGDTYHLLAMTSDTEDAIQSLAVLADLYSIMRDQRDRQAVQKYMKIEMTTLIKHSERALSVINRTLAQLRSPAAIAEAQKLRDNIQRVQDKVRQFAR